MQKQGKILIIILMVSLLSSVAYGAFTDSQTHTYDFTSDFTDQTGAYDFTESGGTIPIDANGADFEAVDTEFLTITQTNLITGSGDNDFTLSMRFKPETLAGTQVLYDEHSSVGLILRITDVGGGVYKLNSWIDNSATQWTTALSDGTEYTMVWTYDDGDNAHYFYLDDNSGDGSTTRDLSSSDASVTQIGDYVIAAPAHYDGYIKFVCMWDRVITSAEITEMMGADDCTGGGAAETPNQYVTLNTNLTNGTLDYNQNQLTFNYSGNFSSLVNTTLVNISFFIDDVHNESFEVNLTEQNIFNITIGDGEEKDYKILFNVSNFNVNATYGAINYSVDTLNPTLSQTDITNNSIFNIPDEVYLAFNVTCSDTNLFSCNVTLYNLTGAGARDSVINQTVRTELTSTSDKINTTLLSTLLEPLGDYEIYAETWDDHTAKEIKEYKTDKLADGYEFEDSIKITSPDLNNMDLIKEVDRYSFDMEFTKTTPTIYVESDNKLHYRYNSKYKGHFVDYENKKWVDFEDSTPNDVKITKVTDYKYKIEPLAELKELTFNSIGDLNKANSSWYFTVTNITASLPSFNHTVNYTKIEFENTTTTFNFNSSWEKLYISMFDIALIYNGTYHNPTEVALNYGFNQTANYTDTFTTLTTSRNNTIVNVTWLYNYTQGNYTENGTSYVFTGDWHSSYTLLYDNNWESPAGRCDIGFDNCDMSVNYTIPAGVNNVVWELKTSEGHGNYTLDNECDFTGNKVQLRVNSDQSGASGVTWKCYNGTGFETLGTSAAGGFIFEEALHYENYSTQTSFITSQQTLLWAPHLYHYNITAVDNITTSAINNFSIIFNDTTLTTTDGLIHRVTDNALENFTINTTNYAQINVTEHDTNISINIGLVPTNSLLIYIYDEQTGELINTTNVTIDVINYANVSNSYTTDTGSTFQSNFAAGNYEINYKAANYTPRSYYTTIVGSDTQTINLYSLSDLDITHQYKNLEVLDESATSLSNATVKMQRYYLSDSEWKTVEMTKTNDEGKSFVFAELYDVPYRFVIDYQGSTRKTTTQSKLDTRDLFFSIDLITSGLDSFYEVQGVTTSLDYSNTTKIWTYNYNAVTVDISQARFVVQEQTTTDTTILLNSTSVADSGAFTVNLTDYEDNDATYYAYGYVTTSEDSVEHLVEVGSISLDETYLSYGLNGLLLSLLIIGTLAMIGLYNPAVSIALALFGVLLTTMSGLMYLNPTWVVGIIIVGIIYIANLKT